MKRINRHVPDVPQAVADRGTDVVERHLTAYGVSRASELPDEGKVRLVRELERFYENEFPGGLRLLDPSDLGWRGFLKRCWGFVTGRRTGAAGPGG